MLVSTHSGTLAWKIPWTEEPGRLQSMGSWRVRRDWATSLSLFTFTHWRRKWQPTPVFLPRESQGRQSLVGCRLWGCTESDMTWSDLAAAAARWSQLVSSGNTYVDLLVMETEFYEMDEDKFPFPFPGDLPNPGIKPRSPALQANSLLAEPHGKPMLLLLSRFSRVWLCATP